MTLLADLVAEKNRRSLTGAAAIALAPLGCGAEELPPLPEALVVVDTDARVPDLVDRLRADFYRADGTWFESRDIPRRDAADWPASFSLYGEHEDEDQKVLVRLRAYKDGKVRDYRGERFLARPEQGDPAEIVAPPPPPAGEVPRLERDGVDVTPRAEPQPGVTIDRLIRIDLDPRERGRVSVTLRSACFGTMADVSGRTTCVDTENERVDVKSARADQEMNLPGASEIVNDFGARVPCQRTPRAGTVGPDGLPFFDEEVCVPGGAFLFGDADVTGLVLFESLDSSPERVAVVPPLLVDRYEVTVARWRRALREGFSPEVPPNPNDDDQPFEEIDGPLCTYSSEPLVEHSREAYPLNCIDREVARSFCQFYGGDLLTEAQWEHAASASGEQGETRYPWGNDEPRCDTHVFARRNNPGMNFCQEAGYGPAPVGAGSGDVSPDGVHDLGGSMAEWVLDSAKRFDTRCWASVGLTDPRCWEEAAALRALRGATWGNGRALLAALRPAPIPATKVSPNVGFRCARRALEDAP